MTENTRVRKWTSKARTGCRTCKARRIKCDETRPICHKCSSTGRVCEGFEVTLPFRSSDQAQTRALLPRQKQPPTHDTRISFSSLQPYRLELEDVFAFDYFRDHAAASLSGHFSSTLFGGLALQIGHQQPVILRAVVAVGSMYHARWLAITHAVPNFNDCPRYHAALKHYNRAISSLSTYIQAPSSQRDPQTDAVILMACLLFICVEILQSDQNGVLNHLISGLQLLYEQSQRTRTISASKRILDLQNPSSDCMHQLSQIYTRLDADSTMYGRRAPYLCPRSFGIWPGWDADIPSNFASVEEGRSHLSTITSVAFGIRGQLLKAAEEMYPPSERNSANWAAYYCTLHSRVRRMIFEADLDGRREAVLRWFQDWLSALNSLEQKLGRSQSTLMLRIQSFYPWFITATLRDSSACDCDRYQSVFSSVIKAATGYIAISRKQKLDHTFAIESGILSSLYLLGIKCRDRFIRKQAIGLLSEHNVQEGLHKGGLYARLCQEFMDLEEKRAKELFGLDPDDSAFLLPEQARFIDVVFGMDSKTPGTGILVCSRFADDESDQIELVERRFTLSL